MTPEHAPQAITRTSLHLQLVGRLQNLIINGALEPGAKVPEKNLCEQFGVSRTPMREALKVLASDGLVDLKPNRGAWVTLVTTDEVEEVFPVLGALEALAGELACANITDDEVTTISKLHDQMVRSYKDRALGAYFDANQQIHHAILSASRNDTLIASSEALSLRMRRARYLANMSEGRWLEAVREHEQMLEHLKARDGKALGQTLKNHIDAKRISVLKWLNQPDEPHHV